MFALKTSTSQLASSNSNLGEFNYRQLPPTRNATGNNFSSSEIRFAWQTSGMRWVDMKRSFIRMRLRLRNGDNSIISDASNIALSMDSMAGMFQSCEFRIAETTVSKVEAHVGQVSALKGRAMKSGAWLDSAGASARMMQPNFEERQSVTSNTPEYKSFMRLPHDVSIAGAGTGEPPQYLDYVTPNTIQFFAVAAPLQNITFAAGAGREIPDLRRLIRIGDTIAFRDGAAEQLRQVEAVFADGVSAGGAALTLAAAAALVNQFRVNYPHPVASRVISRNAGSVELVWQPPLSVFDLPHALPAGRYELILTPRTTLEWAQGALQSQVNAKVLRDLGPAPGPASEITVEVIRLYLDLAEIQGERVDDQTYFLDLVDLKVHKRNVIIDANATTEEEFMVPASTIGLSLAFQDNRAGASTLFPSSQFLMGDKQELSLSRFYLDYAQQKRPRVDADPVFRASADAPEDYTVARYIDTMVQTAGYYKSGGPESIKDWQDRGAYYHFSWPKEGSDRSTRVLVSFAFREAVADGAMLLFAHYRRIARVMVEDGEVVDVRVQDQ